MKTGHAIATGQQPQDRNLRLQGRYPVVFITRSLIHVDNCVYKRVECIAPLSLTTQRYWFSELQWLLQISLNHITRKDEYEKQTQTCRVCLPCSFFRLSCVFCLRHKYTTQRTSAFVRCIPREVSMSVCRVCGLSNCRRLILHENRILQITTCIRSYLWYVPRSFSLCTVRSE